MGTLITTQLNRPALADMSAADIAFMAYAGVQIDTSSQPIDLWGIDISVLPFTVADYANILAVEVILQSNIKLDPASAGDDLGVPGNLVWYKIFRTTTQDYDKTWNFTTPIPLQKGVVYGAWMFLRPTAGFGPITRLVLNLRGRPPGNDTFPYILR